MVVGGGGVSETFKPLASAAFSSVGSIVSILRVSCSYEAPGKELCLSLYTHVHTHRGCGGAGAGAGGAGDGKVREYVNQRERRSFSLSGQSRPPPTCGLRESAHLPLGRGGAGAFSGAEGAGR